MELYIVKAFTADPRGGNYAGVVPLEGAFPPEARMAAIARALGYSETAFALPLPDGRLHLRYFTPTGEIELCGHATIATGVVLRRRGLPDGDYRILTLAGELELSIGETVLMDMAAPEVLDGCDTPELQAELCRVMGAEPSIFPADLRPQIISTGLKDILMPVADRAALSALRPDMPALSAFSERLGVVGVHAFCLAADCTARCRNFAPLYGIDEEAATGTSSGALTWYLKLAGLLPAGGACLFRQGEDMGSPSEIRTTCHGSAIRVGGSAVVLETRTL